MATQINNQFQVAEAELAYLVLNYLEEKGWKKTAGSLKREAKDLLRAGSQRFAVGTIPKPLDTIVSEYLQLTYKESQRAMLQRTNPLAQSIYSLLDFTAGGAAMTAPGVGTTNTTTAPNNNNNGHINYQQQQQQVQMMYSQMGPPPLPQHNGNLAGGAGGFAMMQMGAIDTTTQHQHQQQVHQHTQQQKPPPLTPGGRHAQRKGAPRKRRCLDNEFDSTNQHHHPFDVNTNNTGTTNTTLDPLGNAEYSLFGDISLDDLRFFNGAVEPADVMTWSSALADNLNKNDHSLTGILEDEYNTDFLAKLFNPVVDPNFRFQTFGVPSHAPGAAAPPPPPAGSQAQKRPSTDTAPAQQQQQATKQIPMSPLGGSRLGKRKTTPTKRGTASGVGVVTRKQIERPVGEQTAVEGNEGERRRALAEELAELTKNPKVLEDLINECVG